jgi:nitrile hydratase
MTRIHDMGGRYGDGPVTPGTTEEPVFVQTWHGRALALTLAAGALGRWNIDASRHVRECLPPADYARFGYYEKWLGGLANILVAQGHCQRR